MEDKRMEDKREEEMEREGEEEEEEEKRQQQRPKERKEKKRMRVRGVLVDMDVDELMLSSTPNQQAMRLLEALLTQLVGLRGNENVLRHKIEIMYSIVMQLKVILQLNSDTVYLASIENVLHNFKDIASRLSGYDFYPETIDKKKRPRAVKEQQEVYSRFILIAHASRNTAKVNKYCRELRGLIQQLRKEALNDMNTTPRLHVDSDADMEEDEQETPMEEQVAPPENEDEDEAELRRALDELSALLDERTSLDEADTRDARQILNELESILPTILEFLPDEARPLQDAMEKALSKYSKPRPILGNVKKELLELSLSAVSKMESMNATIPEEQVELGELIGSGGFGDVVKGDWMGEVVALKKLNEKLQLSAMARQELQMESLIWCGLRHPNIVTLYGTCMKDNALHLVLEYCPESLHSVLHDDGDDGDDGDDNNGKRELSEAMMIHYILGIFSGLSFLHGQKLIHRDIKPMNILLKDDRVLLTDFGLSVTVGIEDDEVGTFRLQGTPRYLGPETFESPSRWVYRSDVYSAGIVIWEIIEKEIPFSHHRNHFDLAKELKTGARPMWSQSGRKNSPQWLRELAEACWIGDVNERPTADHVVDFIKINMEESQENVYTVKKMRSTMKRMEQEQLMSAVRSSMEAMMNGTGENLENDTNDVEQDDEGVDQSATMGGMATVVIKDEDEDGLRKVLKNYRMILRKKYENEALVISVCRDILVFAKPPGVSTKVQRKHWKLLLQMGMARVILDMMVNHMDSIPVHECCMETLHLLSTYTTGARTRLVKDGASDIIIRVLREHHEMAKSISINGIATLVNLSSVEEFRRHIIDAGGFKDAGGLDLFEKTLGIFQTVLTQYLHDERVATLCLKGIGNIVVNPHTAEQAVKPSITEMIADCMSQHIGSQETVTVALATLCEITSKALSFPEDLLDSTLPRVFRAMREYTFTSSEIQACGCAILACYAKGQRSSKVWEYEPLEPIVMALRSHKEVPDVQFYGIRAMEELARTSGVGMKIIQNGGAAVLKDAMQTHVADVSIQRSGCKLILALTQSPDTNENSVAIRVQELLELAEAARSSFPHDQDIIGITDLIRSLVKNKSLATRQDHV